METGRERALHHGYVGAAQTAHPGAGKERVNVIGILADAPVGFAHRLIGQGKDLIAPRWILVSGMVSGKKTVVGVKGSVEEVEPIKFLKNQGVDQVGSGL